MPPHWKDLERLPRYGRRGRNLQGEGKDPYLKIFPNNLACYVTITFTQKKGGTQPLTPNMKRFCERYIATANATQAYFDAYNVESRYTARVKGSELLQREDIQEYLAKLEAPLQEQAISERQRKREMLWAMIEDEETKDADRLHAMDILNKMDSEYVTINKNIEQVDSTVASLPLEQLKKLAN